MRSTNISSYIHISRLLPKARCVVPQVHSALRLQNTLSATAYLSVRGITTSESDTIPKPLNGFDDHAPPPKTDGTTRADKYEKAILTNIVACYGCGATAQTVDPGEAGYFTAQRKQIRVFLDQFSGSRIRKQTSSEDAIVAAALQSLDSGVLESQGIVPETFEVSSRDSASLVNGLEPPLCDRCHQLIHHSDGSPIFHPSVDALRDTIAESSYRHHHIYHLVDAADFPMSLIKRIHSLLDLVPQRGRNRRAKHAEFRGGRIAKLSFVVTRSDLFAPKKEQVDKLMPYLTEVLRSALGSVGRNVRMGNIHCVSAQRGWWTKELKSEIWQRGGASWLVGKVNVGKSHLYETIFPKNSSLPANYKDKEALHQLRKNGSKETDSVNVDPAYSKMPKLTEGDEQSALLPPARQESPYPLMPIVSSLAGTTASPIRIPFGNGKGELIDLPGLKRGDIEEFVRAEDEQSLLMKSRITPEQWVLKQGQSLVLGGGLFRITPFSPDGNNIGTVLAYPFTTLQPHVTSTAKALEIEARTEMAPNIQSVLRESAYARLSTAGVYTIDFDVTKSRAGPLTSRSGLNIKSDNLPFLVYSTDIVLEGIGWVELITQVRKVHSNLESSMPQRLPTVEVFSPDGRFVGQRKPLSASLLGGPLSKSRRQTPKRPRRSMASLKNSIKGRLNQQK